MSEMTFEDAQAELGNAIAEDSGNPTAAPAPVLPAEQSPVPTTTPQGENQPPVQPHWSQAQPRDPASGKFVQPDGSLADTPAPTSDTFDGGKFNPDTLPAELQPGWKQLQAEFTRKTQEMAEQRRQFEGVDPALVRPAVELYTALQNPVYLQQFHGELTQALQAQGLSQPQAAAQAAQQMEQATQSQPGSISDALASLRSDPELAPVADTITQLQSQVQAMQADQVAQRESQELAQMQMALAGELQRQEAVLTSQGLTPQDIDRVYELSAFHDGNLLQAAESFKTMRNEWLTDYIGHKETVAATPGVGALPGSGGTSEILTAPRDLDEAHKAALAHLAQGGYDTIG